MILLSCILIKQAMISKLLLVHLLMMNDGSKIMLRAGWERRKPQGTTNNGGIFGDDDNVVSDVFRIQLIFHIHVTVLIHTSQSLDAFCPRGTLNPSCQRHNLSKHGLYIIHRIPHTKIFVSIRKQIAYGYPEIVSQVLTSVENMVYLRISSFQFPELSDPAHRQSFASCRWVVK